jgi:hypothetical protein
VTAYVLRTDAVALGGFGALLLLAPWSELYELIGVPPGEPALWTQAAGVFLVALGYLLWIAPRDARLTQGVALAAAIANLGAAALIVAWLLTGIETDGPGAVLLILVAAVAAAFGAAEAWIASRSVAMLVPGD